MKYVRRLSVVEAADIIATKRKAAKVFKSWCYRGADRPLIEMTREAVRLGITLNIEFKPRWGKTPCTCGEEARG